MLLIISTQLPPTPKQAYINPGECCSVLLLLIQTIKFLTLSIVMVLILLDKLCGYLDKPGHISALFLRSPVRPETL